MGPLKSSPTSNAMPLWPIIVLVVILLVVWTIVPGVKHWRFRRNIAARPSAEADWAGEFPDAMPVVEQVLTLFCDAFAFNRRCRFLFRPDDVVAHVYRNTTGPIADNLELERLTMSLRHEFGVDLAGIFNEATTLRDVVRLAVGGRNPERSAEGDASSR